MNHQQSTLNNRQLTMNRKRGIGINLSLLGLISALTLASCSSPTGGDSYLGAPAKESAEVASAPVTDLATAVAAPKVKPLLRKEASLTLAVDSMDESLKAISTLVRKRQGDILRLDEEQSKGLNSRQIAFLELRIPAEKLETTLDDLAALGVVESRLITAEDVGEQLVDLNARLKNLQKSEEAVLKILERSGSIGDVLKVSQELSTIREQIERITAQETRLRGQVAYSTIRLSLEARAVANQRLRTPVGAIVQETWGQSTRAAVAFALFLLRLAIWGLSFSPYLLAIAAAIYGYKRLKHPKALPAESKADPPTAP